MRCSDVVKMLGISRSKLYDMLNPKSPRFDATFPKRIRIGANSVGFLEHEVSQ
ncbi:AlpA family phage regulatory protein, partial [Aeromonas dhakensis]|uniref:helix-turn-helix transcriptional regulator n=2 Tax=Aeromonadaceae TaxID=84642 RepID=UPI00215864DB